MNVAPVLVMPATGMSVSVKSATNAEVYFATVYTRTSVRNPVKYSAVTGPEFPIVMVLAPSVAAVVVPRAVPLMYIVVVAPYRTTAKCVHVAALTVTVDVICDAHVPLEFIHTLALVPESTSLTLGVANKEPAIVVALTQHSTVKSAAPNVDGRPETASPEVDAGPANEVDEP